MCHEDHEEPGEGEWPSSSDASQLLKAPSLFCLLKHNLSWRIWKSSWMKLVWETLHEEFLNFLSKLSHINKVIYIFCFILNTDFFSPFTLSF